MPEPKLSLMEIYNLMEKEFLEFIENVKKQNQEEKQAEKEALETFKKNIDKHMQESNMVLCFKINIFPQILNRFFKSYQLIEDVLSIWLIPIPRTLIRIQHNSRTNIAEVYSSDCDKTKTFLFDLFKSYNIKYEIIN